MNLVLRIVINAAALILAAAVVPGLHLPKPDVPADWPPIIGISLVFALINTFLKPIVKLLSLPISLFTLGLVGLVINAAMLLVLAFVSERVGLPFRVAEFPPTLDLAALLAAFAGGLIISAVATALSLAFGATRVLGVRL